MIAVTLANPKHLKYANETKADFIEVRTDLYPKADIAGIINRCAKPVILTIKEPRTVLLDHIDLPKVRYVDIDYRLTELIKDFRTMQPKRAQLIVSYHDYKETPSWEDLSERLLYLRRLKPDVIKMVTMIEKIDDLHCIMRLQKKLGKKGIAIGMGELGIISRIYHQNNLFTYARLEIDKAVAPGQLSVEMLKTMHVYGLVGTRIDNSLSALMHNTAFQHHKLPHRYQLWETSNIKRFMEIFNFFQLPGASITMPYKETVMTHVDKVNIHARKIGAVNTLVRRGKTVIGYNTDWIGVEAAIKKYLPRKKVLILGSGGAAAGIYYAAKKNKVAAVNMLTRQEMPTDEDDFDVLVNATPVYDMVLVPEDSLYSKVVMDCNYDTDTELLKHASRKSRVVIDGLPMLIGQGAEQYRLWTGLKMPINVVHQALVQSKEQL